MCPPKVDDEALVLKSWAESPKNSVQGLPTDGKASVFGSQVKNRESPVYRPLVDEVAIPMPFDDLCGHEAHDPSEPPTLDDDPDVDELCKPETFHGHPVVVLRSGTVKLEKANTTTPLRFRLSIIEAKRLLSLEEQPRIYFLSNEIELRISTTVVYTKPIE